MHSFNVPLEYLLLKQAVFLFCVQFARFFYVYCLGEERYGVVYRVSCRHLDLPFTGLAVGGDTVGIDFFDLFEQGRTDLLRALVVFFLESIGTGDATAVTLKDREVEPRNHLQQLDRIDAPSHSLHVAGSMIGHLLVEILAEGKLYLSFVDLLAEEAGGEHDVVADLGVVNLQQVFVFVAHGEGAGRACRENSLVACIHCFLHRRDVEFPLFLSLAGESVGDKCHTAALLLFQEMNAVTARVHDLDKVLTQLREVIVDVAAVEVAHEAVEALLLRLGVTMEPRLKLCPRVGGELAVPVNLHHFVEHRLGRLEAEEEVGQRSHQGSHGTYKVGAGEHTVAQTWRMGAVLDAGCLNDVAHLHSVRTGHLAPLTVEAKLECLVEEVGVFEPIAQQVGAGMLGTGIFRLHGRDGAIDRADAALQALLVVVRADVGKLNLILHSFDLLISYNYMSQLLARDS